MTAGTLDVRPAPRRVASTPPSGPPTRPASGPPVNTAASTALDPALDPVSDPSSNRGAVGAPAASWQDSRPESWQAVSRTTAEKFTLLSLAGSSAERTQLREEIVLLNLPVAGALARRYANRGVPTEDLVQVASLGLLKAIDRFEVGRGQDFLIFATPTITGELKRYFRDCGWTVRPPRRLQELRAQVQRATQTLTHELGRAPTVRELSQRLDVQQEDIIEAMSSGDAYNAVSLDTLIEANPHLGPSFEADDNAGSSTTVNLMALQGLLARLPERERRVLALRFYGNLTQTEIGIEVGLSQMQVCRVLSSSLRSLRHHLTADPAEGEADATASKPG